MLARFFVVLLLAFSLVGMRGVPTVDSAAAISIVDTESSFEGSDATITYATAACDPMMHVLALLPPSAEGPGPPPDLGRVFRPPRSLGS